MIQIYKVTCNKCNSEIEYETDIKIKHIICTKCKNKIRGKVNGE